MTLFKVFDFDGTLVDFDSTEKFFFQSARRKQKRWISITILLLKVLSKLSFISVKRAKEILLNLLFHSYEDFELSAEEFGQTIQLNQIGKEVNPEHTNTIVISASLETILKSAMPEITVVGSKVMFQNNRFKISSHPFRQEKAQILRELIADKQFIFYTDSKNDTPCAKLATTTNWVKNGKIFKVTS
ncbi:HAD family hydrolase [Ekhidna sp.]